MADVTKEPKKIKPQIIIACAVAAAVVIGVAAFLIIRYNSNLLANTVRFLRMQGEVTLLDSKDKEVSIQESMRLSAGNKVITASESFAALGLDDFKIVSLDESTKTGINKKGKKLEIDLQSGGLYFNVTKALEDDEEFNIRTATMITGIRGTCGYISANELYLLEGHVVTTNNFGESIEVEAGQKLIVDAATGKMRIEKYTLYDLPLLVISELARDDFRRAQVLAILGISEDEFWAYAWGLEPAYFDWADLGRERPEEPEEEPEPEVVEEPEEEPAEEPEESKAEEPEEEEPAEEEPEEEPEEEKPVEKTYTITVTASEGGTISASASSAKEGEVISLKAIADGGKEIARWEPDGNVTLDFTNGLDCPTFVMPATNVSVHVAYGWATSQNNTPTPTLYAITMSTADTSKGTVSCNPANAKEGDTVTLTATPNGVYEFAGWTVTSGSVTITNNTFVMPASPVTIDGAFRIAAANLNIQQANGTFYLSASGATGEYINGNTLRVTGMGDPDANGIRTATLSTIYDSQPQPQELPYYLLDFDWNVINAGDVIVYDKFDSTGSIGGTGYTGDIEKNVTFETSLSTVKSWAHFLNAFNLVSINGGANQKTSDYTVKTADGKYVIKYDQTNNQLVYRVKDQSGQDHDYYLTNISNGNTIELVFNDPLNSSARLFLREGDDANGIVIPHV